MFTTNKIAIFIIFSIPIVDAYALYTTSILGLYKILILLFPLVINKVKLTQRELHFLFCLIFIVILSVFFNGIFNQESIIHNLDYGFRLIYPVLLYFLYKDIFSNVSSINKIIDSFIVILLISIFTSLIFSKIIGIGNVIEGRGVNIEGWKGLYLGANEVGVIICIASVLLGGRKKQFNKIFALVSLLLLVICGFLVFTKSSLVGSILSLYFLLPKRRFIKYILLIISIYFIYFEFMDAILNFTSGSFLDLSNKEYLEFMFRGRSNYINSFVNSFNINELSVFSLFFGIGDWEITKLIAKGLYLTNELKIRTSFEMDFLDLFVGFGIIGGGWYLFILVKIYKFFIYYDSFNKNKACKILFFILVTHAFLAGHVLYSVQVSSLVAIICLFSYSLSYKES